jgi:deoxyribodipyrimidine photo-lyase
MARAVVLFTRDLRVHDHPALAAAVARFEHVVPLFVLDKRLLGSANRTAFLLEALADLRAALDGRLVVRLGDPVEEVARVRPDAVYLSEDASAYARTREERLRRVAEVYVFPGTSIVRPGILRPAGGDHYRVFTPYWRAWRDTPIRALAPLPGPIRLPPGVEPGPLPGLGELATAAISPDLPRGGETAGRARVARFLEASLSEYDVRRDVPAADASSRLSPYLHFGCLSAVEVVHLAVGRPGGEPFLRQLCWRDFYLQLLAANPRLPHDDYRPRGDTWLDGEDAFDAWREGRTGYPIVDAAMRQLLREGWIHNRARLLAASFLVKDLGLDWRLGAEHFARLLVDGDLASNAGNWQWVAGTGTDTRPNRVFNPLRQARRFDPEGAYVRRYVPELAALGTAEIHEPWRLGRARRARIDYPAPLVDHAAAASAFLAGRRR